MVPSLREPDAFDYGVVAALTLSLYLQFPWRPAVRRTLRGAVGAVSVATTNLPETVATLLSLSPTFGENYAVAMVVLFVAVAFAVIGVVPYKFG